MGTAIEQSKSVTEDFGAELVQFWLNRCNGFLRWQRKVIFEQEPYVETSAAHRQNLKAMLRLGRLLHAEVGDPDSSLFSLSSEVSGKLLQLEASWEMINNTIPPIAADKILQKVFPDESRTGRSA